MLGFVVNEIIKVDEFTPQGSYNARFTVDMLPVREATGNYLNEIRVAGKTRGRGHARIRAFSQYMHLLGL